MPFAEGQDDSEVDHVSADALQHTFGTNNLDHLLTVHLFFLTRRLARCPLLHFQETGISYESRWIMTLPTLTYWTFYSDAYATVNVLVSNASAFRTLSLYYLSVSSLLPCLCRPHFILPAFSHAVMIQGIKKKNGRDALSLYLLRSIAFLHCWRGFPTFLDGCLVPCPAPRFHQRFLSEPASKFIVFVVLLLLCTL